MPGGLGAFAILVAAALVLLAFVLVWLLSRDKGVERTSFGFYVERRRYTEVPLEEKITESHVWPKREDEV
jgi:hypothetical protein